MKLDNLIKITNGYAFQSKSFTANNNNSNEIPVVKIKELKNGVIQFTKDTCFVNYDPLLDNYLLKNGDILVALTGNPPTKGGIGAMVGRCSKYNLDIASYLNQRVCKVESSSKQLNNKYLYYFLSLNKTIYGLASKCSGSANQANISSNDIKNMEFNLIPIDKQQHIVNINRSNAYA